MGVGQGQIGMVRKREEERPKDSDRGPRREKGKAREAQRRGGREESMGRRQ